MTGKDSEIVEDATSITSGGGTETSAEFDTKNDSDVALIVEGDSNSQDLDITCQAKARNVSGDAWAEHDQTTAEDLTGTNNTARTYIYDVKNLRKVRWKFKNDHGSNTTITAIASREQ